MRGQHSHLLKKLWHKKIPLKISFLGRRMIKRKLSFDDILARFAKNLVSICFCCLEPKCESMQRMFVEIDIARHMWNFFGAPLGIKHQLIPVAHVFNNWFSIKPKNYVHRMVLQVTSVVIYWKIWKGFCSCKFGNQRRMVYISIKREIS